MSQCETNVCLRDPIPVRSTLSEFLNTLLPFLLVLLDCTPPFPLFLSSPFLFDYLPSAYLFSAQLWNISEIIIFPFVITLVSRSNSLWSLPAFIDYWLSPEEVGFSSHFASSGLIRMASLMLQCSTLWLRVWTVWDGVVLRYVTLADRESCFAEN